MSAEGTVKAVKVGGSIYTQIKPSPSLAPVQYWQGIVEIISKGVVLVSLFILFIASAVANDEASNLSGNASVDRAKAAAGWTIFLGIVGLFYGIIYLVCRFVNFAFMTNYRTVVLVTDIIFNGALALLIFTGAASQAATASFLTDALGGDGGQFDSIITATRNAIGASAFFAFVTMFIYIFITLWMVLFLVLKWDIKSGSGGSGGEKSDPV